MMTAKLGIPFSSQDDAYRMHVRRVAEDLGADVEGYDGPSIQLLLPRDWLPVVEAMAECGLRGGEPFLFPLGSRQLPDHLRHDGRYPGSRGFELHCDFAPAPVAVA
jgi:hypothetical protein